MDKVKIKLGPFVSMDVVVKTAVEAESKDTKLVTVCIGQKDAATPHDPVKVNGLMRCSHADCGREEKSYHPFPRGRDNGDGTFTIPKAEDIAAAAIDRSLVETIDLTSHPVEDVERHTLPLGDFYWLAPGKDAARSYDAFVRVVRESTDKAFCAMYARSTAPRMWRIVAQGSLLGLQELTLPAALKPRPATEVDEATDVFVAQLQVLSATVHAEFDPANFADTRQAVIAAALANTEAIAAGDETPLATVTHLPKPDESPFALAMRAAGLDPNAVQAPAAPKKRASRKKTVEEAPPVQPLPSEVPGNVDTTLVVPKKRAARKTVAKSA